MSNLTHDTLILKRPLTRLDFVEPPSPTLGRGQY